MKAISRPFTGIINGTTQVVLVFQRDYTLGGPLDDARTWLDAAQRLLPAYAQAQGHLAEVESELGETETAIARLSRLAISSDGTTRRNLRAFSARWGAWMNRYIGASLPLRATTN
jgi:hypothetical protein